MMSKKQPRRSEIFRLMVEQSSTARAVRERPGGVAKWQGYMVKRAFPQIANRGPQQEFMWVEVTSTTKEGRLVGRLANRPVLATYLRHGDVVEFNEAEVVAAERPAGATRS